MKKYSIFLVVPLILFLTQTSLAVECGFGTPAIEGTFHRAKGEPVTEHLTFFSVNGKATIKLYNGGVEQNKLQRVTDATVRVNGNTVFDEMQFNKQVTYLEAQVELFDENDIEVYLEGKIDSKVTIQIFHEEIDAVREFWHVVEELYETAPPPDAVLIDWFNNNVAEDFINEQRDRTDELIEWIDEPLPIGIKLCPVIGPPIDVTGTPYAIGHQVSIEITVEGESDSVLTYMVHNGTNWLWYGDRALVDPDFESFMSLTFEPYIEYPIYETGLAITLWDHNYSAYDLAVRSGIVTGPGLPPEGIKLNHEYPQPFLRLYESSTYDDHFHYLLEDESILAIHDDSEYIFSLYAEDPAVVTLGNTPIVSFTKTIHKRPVLNADLNASMFPTLITPSTHYADEWGIGGVVDVEWTNPDSMQVDWLAIGLWLHEDPWFANFWIGVTPGDTSVSIDTTGGVWTNQVYMHGNDEYGRRFAHTWRFFP